MLVYWKSFSGVALLIQIHGSAIYRASFPAMLSAGVYLLLVYYNICHQGINHPYAMGGLISSAVLMLVYRLNHSYERCWEACSAVQLMTSKWLDAAVHTATFHMQCKHYDKIRPFSTMPPSSININGKKKNGSLESLGKRQPFIKEHSAGNCSINGVFNDEDTLLTNSNNTARPDRLDGGWGLLYDMNNHDQDSIHTASWASGVTPSLFLQEVAHLSSLCVAVAFCSLGNLYDTEICIKPYIPKHHVSFPNANTAKIYYEDSKDSKFSKFKEWIVCSFGMERTGYYHKIHSECPMLVLGGISEAEKTLLSQARGGAAKTTLVWFWLNEFITREHLEGSTGDIDSAIISRTHQFLSDGMVGYSNAKKISFLQYPLPLAQLNAFLVFCLIIVIPFTMQQYTNTTWVGITLVFITVTLFVAMQEVACGLENPFINFPNDVPLRTLLAMHNEALIQMCSGYHPDMRFGKMKKET